MATARQKAASRANLVKARAAKRRAGLNRIGAAVARKPLLSYKGPKLKSSMMGWTSKTGRYFPSADEQRYRMAKRIAATRRRKK